MFENLPDKIKKLYQEKIKEDDSKHKRKDNADNLSKLTYQKFIQKIL